MCLLNVPPSYQARYPKHLNFVEIFAFCSSRTITIADESTYAGIGKDFQ